MSKIDTVLRNDHVIKDSSKKLIIPIHIYLANENELK